MKTLVEQIEDSAANRDPAAQSRADTDFHMALAKSTHNELIIAISIGLQQVMLKWMLTQTAAFHFGDGTSSHRTVYEAIVDRDADRAREAMAFHMSTTRRSQLGACRQAGRRELRSITVDPFQGHADILLGVRD